jgi:uncharacterized repeat protein (TIGR03833 family)
LALTIQGEGARAARSLFSEDTMQTQRANIHPGQTVLIVLKQDQRSGKLTRGIVQDILTPSATHPRGIKVRLRDGQVGRVQQIISAGDEAPHG